jgi:NADP-dependent 3-hydroxy acid dehydrogenase YdfG
VCVNYAVHADAAETLVAEIATSGARTEAELGPVTILVNNAGVAWQGTLDTYEQEQVAELMWMA